MPYLNRHIKKAVSRTQVKDVSDAEREEASQIEADIKALSDWAKTEVGKIDMMLYTSLQRFTSQAYLAHPFMGAGYSYSEEGIEKGIREPATYILKQGGKRLRPLASLLTMKAFGADPDKYLEFAIIPEVIHTGTLIHDDIEDNSKKRRNNLAVHVVYGEPLSINLGSLMYFLPLNAIKDSKKIDESVKYKMLSFIIDDMTHLGTGQSIDIAWHDQKVDIFSIKEEEIMGCLANKTGALLGIAMKIGAAIGGADDQIIKKIGALGAMFGTAFQLRDDVLNIVPSAVSENKGGIGDDIKEGKMTVLAEYALHHSSKEDAKELAKILSKHTSSNRDVRKAIGIIKRSGAVEYVEKLAKEKTEETLKLLEEIIPESDAKRKIRAMFIANLNRKA